jgi:hypothetical protein
MLFVVEEMKLVRNDRLDNKKHKKVFLALGEEKLIPGKCKLSSRRDWIKINHYILT